MNQPNPYEPPQALQKVIASPATRPPNSVAFYVTDAKTVVAVTDTGKEIYRFCRHHNFVRDLLGFLGALVAFFAVGTVTNSIASFIGYIVDNSGILESYDFLPNFIFNTMLLLIASLCFGITCLATIASFRTISPRFHFSVFAATALDRPLKIVRHPSIWLRLRFLEVLDPNGQKVAEILTTPYVFQLQLLKSSQLSVIRLTKDTDCTFSLVAFYRDNATPKELGLAQIQDDQLVFQPLLPDSMTDEYKQLAAILLVTAFIIPAKRHLFLK